MSSIGYYRYKTSSDVKKDIQFFKNGILAGTKSIQPISHCVDGIILKYLDTNGQYRFYPFNKYYEVSDSPSLIGSTNDFITNILTDNSNSRNVGYKNKRTVLLTSDATAEELTLLSDIYTSPRVYMYIGDGASDSAKDWLLVSIKSSGNLVKRRKANSGRIDITVSLPEHYTIKMI